MKSRGGWTSPIALEKEYSRLHQHGHWESPLASGEAAGAGGNSRRCAVAPKTPLAEPTEEGGSPGGEEAKAQRLEYLTARGLLRPLYGGSQCPSCGRRMNTEGLKLFHVRCLAEGDNGTFKPYCFSCWFNKALEGPEGVIDARGILWTTASEVGVPGLLLQCAVTTFRWGRSPA